MVPGVWDDPRPTLSDEGVWAVQEILLRCGEIATALNADPPEFDPVFWEREGDDVIATDWCEGFMDAFALREQQWDELLETEEGQDWMFPILAHLFDDDGNSLSGASTEELSAVLDEAAKMIPDSVARIFTFWQSKRSPHAEASNAATAPTRIAQSALPRYSPDELKERSEKELFVLLLGHEDRVPMEVIKKCAAREDARREDRHIARESDNSPWATNAKTSLGDTYVRHAPKIGRNDPCPCGSGKKYKKCCLTRLH